MAKIAIFPAPQPSPVNTVSLRAIGATSPEPPQWLVKGILPRTGIALLSGQYAAGKTFVGADLCLSLVFDQEFLGRRVRPGGVLWIAAEGGGEIDSRVEAARAGKFQDGHAGQIPFFVSEPPAGLSQHNIIIWLEHAVAEASWECADKFAANLRLVVIDTLAACFNIADENDNAEAARLMKELARVGNANDVLVMPIAHHGKNAETGVRGASAYGAGADAILSVLGVTDVSGKTSKRSLALTKSRRGGTGSLGSFEVRSHVLGLDEDGDPMTAGYIEFSDDAGEATPQAVVAKVKSKIPRDFTESFNEALASYGQDYKIPEGPTVKAVSVTEVRNNFMRRYITGNPEKTDSAKYKAFDRALDAARDENMIAGASLSQNKSLIWPVLG
ncbi:AAA family ATPase [Bradyrhizobium iriomotense]|uniref:AAA family ATPase n=1 Tax=Bradyrhizobium iriomotense TaxID=441950 RepID=UPI001B8A5F0B|nr:AAA family ATPase [Bradyrhizobium iriomotense]MBR1131928.1 AAA family ATPase [Bradyrhizobium iriomotense]